MAKYLSWTVSVFLFTATLGAGVVEAPVRLEHFQCYPVIRSAPDIEVGVGLSDQFSTDLEKEKVLVRDARWFCNPTRKLHRGHAFGIGDIRQHLTFYWTLTERREPTRIVKIHNQFGQQTLRTHESLFLAVPTQKARDTASAMFHDFPQDLDHFKCYRATGRRVRRPSVGLSDQFILPVTRHRVRKPVAFCNPAEKQHTDIINPIYNPLAHLTCYSMTAGDAFIGQTGIRNQFGPQGLLVGTPRVLCVPTRKLGFEEPIPDGTVGDGLTLRRPLGR